MASRDYDQRVLVVNDGSEDEKVLVVNGDVINTTTAAEGDFLARQSGLWVPRKIVDADIPASIARDAEVTAAVNAEAALRAAADSGLQPLDSDLTAIAALTTTAYGRAFLALANAAAGRTALGLGSAATSATTDFDAAGAAAAAQAASQPLDSDLTAIAALVTTTFGRNLLTYASAAAMRTAQAAVTGWDAETGCHGASLNRDQIGNAAIASVASGVLLLVRAWFDGQPFSNITFVAGTTGLTLGSSGNHLWKCVTDSSLNLLAITADDTAASWSASAEHTQAVATTAAGASGTYTPPNGDPFLGYIGLLVAIGGTGGTVPTLSGATGNFNVNSNAPVRTMKANASLTTPSTFATQYTAGSTQGNVARCRVS